MHSPPLMVLFKSLPQDLLSCVWLLTRSIKHCRDNSVSGSTDVLAVPDTKDFSCVFINNIKIKVAICRFPLNGLTAVILVESVPREWREMFLFDICLLVVFFLWFLVKKNIQSLPPYSHHPPFSLHMAWSHDRLHHICCLVMCFHETLGEKKQNKSF